MSNKFSVSVYSIDDGEFLGSCDCPGTYPAIVITTVEAIGFDQKNIVMVQRIIGEQQVKLALSNRISIPPCSLSVFVQTPIHPTPLSLPKLEPKSPQIPEITPQSSNSDPKLAVTHAYQYLNQSKSHYAPTFASKVPSHPLVTIREAKLLDVFHDAMHIVERIEAGLQLLPEQEAFFRRRAAYYLGAICANKYQPTKTERRDFMIALVGPYNWDVDKLVSTTRIRAPFDMACNNMTSAMSKNMGIQRKKRKQKPNQAGSSLKKPVAKHLGSLAKLIAALKASKPGSEKRQELIAKTSSHRKSLAVIDPFNMLKQYPIYLKDQNLAIYDFNKTFSDVTQFSNKMTDTFYDCLSVMLQLDPNKPKLEDILGLYEFSSDIDRKCCCSLIMIHYLVTKLVLLENVLSPMFFNDLKDMPSILDAVNWLECCNVTVPCIVRLAEPAENPYYVVFRNVPLHVEGDFSIALIILYSFYQTFNAHYPKRLLSMMRVVGVLLDLKHLNLTSEETRLLKTLNSTKSTIPV